MTADNRYNIAIFASGSGSNAENLTRAFADDPAARVSLVLANRRNAGVFDRMHSLGVPCEYVANEVWDTRPKEILEMLAERGIDAIALAGFMRMISPVITSAYEGRMANIHPSLLPAYGGKGMYGRRVHEAVIAAKETRSGATVHIVTDRMDEGRILMQKEVAVLPDDTPETLEARVHGAEYEIYPAAMRALIAELADKPA